jgi:hypothetical protein
MIVGGGREPEEFQREFSPGSNSASIDTSPVQLMMIVVTPTELETS